MNEIKFDISIDEEGLLPGINESRNITGLLAPVMEKTTPVTAQFDPIDDQHHLNELGLTSEGKTLSYTLSQNNQLLTATANDEAVFSVQLEDNGTYTFTLHSHIDRASPPNLVTNGDLQLEAQTPMGWKIEPLFQSTLAPVTVLSQSVTTESGAPYQLTFHYSPTPSSLTEVNPIYVYWGNQLLYTLDPHQKEAKGYSFSLEGDPHQNSTQLQFVGIDNGSFFKDFINHISVVSNAQNKLPIELSYAVTEDNASLSHHHFTVNITTTPPIQLNNQEPFDIIYDQGVYQTIIVSDQNPRENPMTTINLDALFKNMEIPNENRVIEVVQLQENGLASNVYEVKISDKNQILDPITVADVRLSFPGGDGGLSVFHRNIYIDEREQTTVPVQDHNLI